MIKETAIVVAVEGDKITVEAAIKSTCSSCQVQSDCGTGVVSRALAPKTQQLVLHTPMPVNVGQRVTVGVPEAGVLSASAWLYILPLLTFIGTTLFASLLFESFGLFHELWPMVPAIATTYFAYRGIARHLSRLDNGKYQAVLLQTLS